MTNMKNRMFCSTQPAPIRRIAPAALLAAVLGAVTPFAGAQPALLLPPAATTDPALTANDQRPVLSLDDLLARASTDSPLLAVARSDILAARAGLITARAYPNPELEVLYGRQVARTAAGDAGASPQIGIAQPLENPWLRASRGDLAESRIAVAEAQTATGLVNLMAAVKRRYFERLRLEEELQAFREDLALTEQIRQRVQVRVRSGEAPRFDLYRADSEVAVARKNVDTTLLRIRQSTFELRQFVGPSVPDDFALRPLAAADRTLTEEDFQRLRAGLLRSNPDIAVAQREMQRAERQVALEQNSILPQVTLRAMQERDPLVTANRIGAHVTLPLVNRREGPIAEARAQVERSRLSVQLREFETTAAFDAAWQSYRAASAQLNALEGTVIGQARTVLEIAEAAYRLGERGILEYLDAQRQFRLVRNELIQARFAQQNARVELERLAGR